MRPGFSSQFDRLTQERGWAATLPTPCLAASLGISQGVDVKQLDLDVKSDALSRAAIPGVPDFVAAGRLNAQTFSLANRY